jgi:hypothetical protein
MSEDANVEKERLSELQQGRAQLIEQIRESQRTIERSQELIKRIDDLLADTGPKP